MRISKEQMLKRVGDDTCWRVEFFRSFNREKINTIYMKIKGFISFWFFLTFGLLIAGCSEKNPVVLMKTELGDIKIEIYEKQAPVTAANFLKYVDEQRYAGAHFYRVVTINNQPEDSVKIQVIQGGLGFEETDIRLAPIEHETTRMTGLRHKDGVISMARLEPGTTTCEFFICVGDQPELDYGGKRNPDGQGFAAFGRAIQGMDVVKKIHQQPVEGQMLLEKIMIHGIRRIK